MQHTRAADWQERELAQLRNEVAVLTRLVRAITPHGHESTDTHGHGMETSTPQKTLSKKRTIRYARLADKKRLRALATSP
jgi:hypothetical protein